MEEVIHWLELTFARIPGPLLGVWGRVSFILGLALAVCAFGGFTFRVGGRWGFGRERQAWDSQAFSSVPLTFVLVTLSGYLGSFIVLVPGAQTFESLKDLTVFLCVVLFGYPALVTVPFAYGLSDLIEGVPPAFLLAWLPGYLINPACFWLGHQLIGRDPDFRRARTWARYALFVALFMATEPILWGYICSAQFTPEIAYRNVTAALFFTTGITWLLAPPAMLVALPLARRFKLFWAEIPGHVSERPLRRQGREGARASNGVGVERDAIPIRMFIGTPFIALVLLLVGATAFVTLRSAEEDANKLAIRLHQEISDGIKLRVDNYWAATLRADPSEPSVSVDELLARLPVSKHGRALIIDRSGALIGASAADDPVVNAARTELHRVLAGRPLTKDMQFRFDQVTERPLSRETWLASASVYRDPEGRRADWILTTLTPEAYYLAGVRTGNSRSAMVFALALLLSLAVAAVLASTVTAPLRRISRATRALADGDLSVRVPESPLDELGTLAQSFNQMAAQVKTSFEAVKASEVHLEDLVRKRTLELEAEKERADAASRAKSTFLAHMSHEIRTPMNAILGFGQLMARESDLTSRDRDRLRKMLTSAYHLLGLINNVLDMSKIEAGRAQPAKAVLDLHAAIADVDGMVRTGLEAKQLQFLVEGVERLPRYVRSDAAKLRQILLNLLGNATKFTARGRVVLRGRVGARDDEPMLVLEVEDTGVGIGEAELDLVFQPFEQTKSGLAAQTGTGLGAAISRDLARLLGGELSVKSRLGSGTTFLLELPLELAESGELPPLSRAYVTAVAEGQARRTVLVADDDENNRAVLRELLAHAGLDVVEASDGAGAVAAFERTRPALVFMDVKMPVFDGIEATRRIRGLEQAEHVPIVLLSASVFSEDRPALLRTGANAFITKPYREEEIWGALESLLGLSLVRTPVESSVVPPSARPRRDEVAELGPEIVAALREAVELGYLARVPGILARAPAQHRALAFRLEKLASELEIEALLAVL